VIIFLARLVRVLFVLFLVRLLLRAFAGAVRGGAVAPTPARKKSMASELVRDRICNTYVLRERALRVRLEGRDEYFCSEACRDRGVAAPAIGPAP
jgi:uncharacterized protein